MDFEHPNDIAPTVRSISGLPADSIPDVREGFNAATGEGYLPSVATPESRAAAIPPLSDAEIESIIPVNSPQYRSGHGVPPLSEVRDEIEEAEEYEAAHSRRRAKATDDYISDSQNFVDIDAGVGMFAGHNVELKKNEVATIKAVLGNAVRRQLLAEAQRVQKAFGKLTAKPKRRKLRKVAE